ncbi:hypothetical protein E2C01_094825 [Portunus trituberculatus]|uniref:Uncharacterized protein n=1 Tax=Portunus trituberculatus TaxID=210409 RepID=A0A5B7JTI2_PORTR|nr:hypothetical protein [Portunus trituberculatus]
MVAMEGPMSAAVVVVVVVRARATPLLAVVVEVCGRLSAAQSTLPPGSQCRCRLVSRRQAPPPRPSVPGFVRQQGRVWPRASVTVYYTPCLLLLTSLPHTCYLKASRGSAACGLELLLLLLLLLLAPGSCLLPPLPRPRPCIFVTGNLCEIT